MQTTPNRGAEQMEPTVTHRSAEESGYGHAYTRVVINAELDARLDTMSREWSAKRGQDVAYDPESGACTLTATNCPYCKAEATVNAEHQVRGGCEHLVAVTQHPRAEDEPEWTVRDYYSYTRLYTREELAAIAAFESYHDI